jgi:DNA-binding Lrp family transcriptional regulator
MLDDLDRALIHALHIDGRAPFSRIAAVLGVSAQTVARRYRRVSGERPALRADARLHRRVGGGRRGSGGHRRLRVCGVSCTPANDPCRAGRHL